MAGLLDFLGSDDPQEQGQLGLIASILSASGPSRTPVSMGQVLGAGLGGYQQGRQQALAGQAARQNLKINDIRLQDLESDLKNQEAQRQRASELQKAAAEYWQGGSAAPATNMPFQGGQSGAAAMQGLIASGSMPSAPSAPAAPAASGDMPGAGRNSTPYQQRMAYASFLRSKGFGTEAQAEEDSALKLQPKVKDWSKVTVNGKVMFAPYFEDGTHGEPVPLEVAEKLELQNTGGKTLALNPFTGATVASYANTVDPNTAAQVGVQRDRLSFDRSQANKPQFIADAGGYVSPPSASAPQGSFTPVAGFAKSADKQKVADANEVLALLKQAAPLIDKSTHSYLGTGGDHLARAFGYSTNGDQAAAQLKAIEGMLISKMPKMSGPQSDKDVELYRQMAGQVGDPTVPPEVKKAAMGTIRQINQRYANSGKTITLADIAETARKSGKTTAEVTAAAKEQGYTIGGQ